MTTYQITIRSTRHRAIIRRILADSLAAAIDCALDLYWWPDSLALEIREVR